jgi:hypothetical protein
MYVVADGMASFTVRFHYVLRYASEVEYASEVDLDSKLDWPVWRDGEGRRFEYRVTVDLSADKETAVSVHATATIDVSSPNTRTLDDLEAALGNAIDRAIKHWTTPSSTHRQGDGWISHYRHPNSVIEFAKALKDSCPHASVSVPLFGSDRDVVCDANSAQKTLAACIAETYPFWADQDHHLAGTMADVDGHDLVVTADSPPIALGCAKAYLTARRRRAAPRTAVSAKPIWALSSVALALLSFGMSWAPLNWATLTTFAVLAIVIAALAIINAPRLGARRAVTVAGLGPILTLVLFAWVYGLISLLDAHAITSYGHRPDYLRDPFLLGLSLLTTVGVLDLALHGWVRSIAYLEMLLVAGAAGGAAVVAARRLSIRAQQIVDELRLERG